MTLLASVPGPAPDGAEGGIKLLKLFDASLLFALTAVPALGKD
jgi:hypothetical protein